ncbi:MAG: topoisomerase DNA-binding C4 zinc finger domain-containing protein, partial [Clostridiales bacterium]|nr:topoisomerase DNA-binding C4 zinc finger domain-containing protein [Clostridiales bacterium]
ARQNLTRIKVADEVSDVVCDKCGRNMVIKYGPHGKFLACPGFPECRNTMPLLEKAGVKCPQCGAEIIKRRTKKGRLFYACENKECDYISWQKPGKAKKT